MCALFAAVSDWRIGLYAAPAWLAHKSMEYVWGAIRQQVNVLPPIYRDAKRLLIMVEQAVMGFARYHRYSIGADLRQQAMKVLRLVHRALREKSQQAKHVKNLVWALDDLRLSLQLAKELSAFRSFAVFEQLAQLCQQVGKQSGGWLKSLQNTADNP